VFGDGTFELSKTWLDKMLQPRFHRYTRLSIDRHTTLGESQEVAVVPHYSDIVALEYGDELL